MEISIFSEIIADIYMWFDRKLPNQEQVELWYTDLKWMSEDCRETVLNEFKKYDGLPRNVPKCIRYAYQKFRKEKPKYKEYDPYDDPSFPISFLWSSLDILEIKGDSEFLRYCRSVRMPSQDIERVKRKYNKIYDIKPMANSLFESIDDVIKNENEKHLEKMKEQARQIRNNELDFGE